MGLMYRVELGNRADYLVIECDRLAINGEGAYFYRSQDGNPLAIAEAFVPYERIHYIKRLDDDEAKEEQERDAGAAEARKRLRKAALDDAKRGAAVYAP